MSWVIELTKTTLTREGQWHAYLVWPRRAERERERYRKGQKQDGNELSIGKLGIWD